MSFASLASYSETWPADLEQTVSIVIPSCSFSLYQYSVFRVFGVNVYLRNLIEASEATLTLKTSSKASAVALEALRKRSSAFSLNSTTSGMTATWTRKNWFQWYVPFRCTTPTSTQWKGRSQTNWSLRRVSPSSRRECPVLKLKWCLVLRPQETSPCNLLQ